MNDDSPTVSGSPDPVRAARLERAKHIFLDVVSLPPQERDAEVLRRCEDDHKLISLVHMLLAGDGVTINAERIGEIIREAYTQADSTEGRERPGSTIGHYELIERLGEGGFGEVFMARQEQPVRRLIALKVLKPGMDSRQVLARFEAERHVLALMDHPGIARVFDAGVAPSGRPYFVMELVRGPCITDYCDQHKLSIADRLELIEQVCDALQHAHQKGIIHRDIKPGNILINTSAEPPTPKIIDFGIAKATGPCLGEATSLTEMHQLLGTPEYMSPEQAGLAEGDIDTRTDVYSLGVLLYELLVGDPPFDARKLRSAAFGEMQRIIREVDPPQPSLKLRSNLDTLSEVASRRSLPPNKLPTVIRGELDWIVMRAMEKDRSRRYESAGAMGADIRRFLTGGAVLAAPPSRAYQVRKFVRRHRLPVAASLAVLTVLTAGLMGTTYGLLKSKRAELKEREERFKAQAANKVADEQRQIAEARTSEAEYESYIAQIALAASAIESGEGARAKLALDRCPERRRGWEWRYLHDQLDSSSGSASANQIPGLESNALAVSLDGSLVVTAWSDGRAPGRWGIRLADAHTLAEHRILLGHDAPVVHVSFSPDGRWILTGSLDTTLRIYDTNSGDLVSVLKGHTGHIIAAAFTSDSRRVVSIALNDPTVRVWDPKSGACRDFETPDLQTFYSVAPLPGTSNMLLTAGFREPLVFDPEALVFIDSSIPHPRTLGERANLAIASGDGRELAVANGAGRASLVDLASGVTRARLIGHTVDIYDFCFSGDGTRVYSAGHDGTAREWDAITGEPRRIFLGHQGPVTKVRIAPDDRTLYTAGSDGSIRTWDLSPDARIFQSKDALDTFRAVRFTPDGAKICVAAESGSLLVLDAASRRLSRTIPVPGRAISLLISHDSRRAYVGLANGAIAIVDLVTGASSKSSFATQLITVLALSPDGTRLAVGSSDRTCRVLDAADGHPLFRIGGVTGGVSALAFSPDGNFLIGSAGSPELQRWRVSDGQAADDVPVAVGPANSICFDRAERMLVAGNSGVSSVIPAGFTKGDPRPVIELRGHTDGVLAAVFSPDGSRVASVGLDGTARIWDPATGKELLTIRSEPSFLSSVAFSPDGGTIAISGDRSSAQFFDANTSRFPAVWNRGSIAQ